MPNAMTNGTAQVMCKSAKKTLTLSFKSDPEGFALAVDFANDKIAEANGSASTRKFLLRSSNGAKLEVFEDYISIKRQGRGVSGLMGQGDSTEIMMIPNIKGMNASSGSQIVFNYINGNGAAVQSAFAFNPADGNTINEIISYVRNYNPAESASEETEETWKIVTGSEKNFSLFGKTLTVNENWDVYNSYRKMYMGCASKYTEQLKVKYSKKIHDFDSFMQFYPSIYKEYLEKMVKKTTDILVSAGIWTETNESIMQRHIEVNHLAMDDYTTLYNSMMLTVQNNKQSMSAITGLVPNLVGGGFGLKGAMKGIAKATAFNLVRDGAASALVGGMNISGTQKAELYGRIRKDILFDRAYRDYWHVFDTLINILNENGKSVWAPSPNDSLKADNIMKNVSNPNFPQEQFPDVMISVIGMDPYKEQIYDLLLNRGADANDVLALKEYFGYGSKTAISKTAATTNSVPITPPAPVAPSVVSSTTNSPEVKIQEPIVESSTADKEPEIQEIEKRPEEPIESNAPMVEESTSESVEPELNSEPEDAVIENSQSEPKIVEQTPSELPEPQSEAPVTPVVTEVQPETNPVQQPKAEDLSANDTNNNNDESSYVEFDGADSTIVEESVDESLKNGTITKSDEDFEISQSKPHVDDYLKAESSISQPVLTDNLNQPETSESANEESNDNTSKDYDRYLRGFLVDDSIEEKIKSVDRSIEDNGFSSKKTLFIVGSVIFMILAVVFGVLKKWIVFGVCLLIASYCVARFVMKHIAYMRAKTIKENAEITYKDISSKVEALGGNSNLKEDEKNKIIDRWIRKCSDDIDENQNNARKASLNIGIVAGVLSFFIVGLIFVLPVIIGKISDSSSDETIESVEIIAEETTVETEVTPTPTPTSTPTPTPTPTPVPVQSDIIVANPVDLGALVTDITASSIDEESGGNYYYPSYIMDGDITTCWAEGVEGNGIGEYVTIYIPEGTLISGIVVFTGYCKSADVFYNNGAPSVIDMSCGDYECSLDLNTSNINYAAETYEIASSGIQFTFPSTIVSNGSITLTIADVRDGASWNDTCISEVRLLGASANGEPVPYSGVEFPNDNGGTQYTGDWYSDFAFPGGNVCFSASDSQGIMYIDFIYGNDSSYGNVYITYYDQYYDDPDLYLEGAFSENNMQGTIIIEGYEPMDYTINYVIDHYELFVNMGGQSNIFIETSYDP